MNNFRLVTCFLLRRAGFPFHLLEELAAPLSSALAKRVVEKEEEAARLRRRLLTEILPKEVATSAGLQERARLRMLSSLRHCIGHNLEPREADVTACMSSDTSGPPLGEWLDARRASMLARTELEQGIHVEDSTVQERLREIAGRADLRNAIFLLSPDFFKALDRWSHTAAQVPATAKARAFELRLFLFLQRLASKNETTSFFGPLTYGAVSQDVSNWSFGAETPEGVTRREVFVTFWAAAALGQAACKDEELRRALPVRRLGIISIQGQTARTATGAELKVTANMASLLQAINGQLTVSELATQLNLSVEECETLVGRLEQWRLVRRDLEPVSTEAHPLAELQSRLPANQGGEYWRHIFEDFNGLLHRFAPADLAERQELLVEIESRFHEITGTEARRAPGRMYADRQVLYEDCRGDMQPVLCPIPEAERIERELAPVMRLGAAYGELRHRAIRTLATRVMDELGPRVPFLTFAEAIDDPARSEELHALLEPARIFLARLQQRVLEASDGEVACLSAEDVEVLIEREPTARAVSLDLMFEHSTTDTPPRIVLGEAHPYVFAWGSQAYFALHKSELREAFSRDLSPWGGQGRMATVLRRRQHKGLVSSDFPGRFIEISGRSSVQPDRRMAIADVMVVASENGPILQAPDGEELQLYVGENDHLHLLCFAPAQVQMPLIRCGSHIPRIQIGQVVYQRRRWEIAENALPGLATAQSSTDLAVEIARQQMLAAWPRHLFAKSSSEPKPICLDLDIPLAQVTLQKLLQKGALVLVEMLPGPSSLWLHRRAGQFTSELRVQFVQ